MIAGAASPFAIFWHHGSSARSRSSHSDCAASSVGTGRSTSGGGGGISVGGGSGGGDGGDNTDPVPPPLKLDGVEKARARAGGIGGVRDSIQSSCTPDAGDRGGWVCGVDADSSPAFVRPYMDANRFKSDGRLEPVLSADKAGDRWCWCWCWCWKQSCVS